MLRSLTALLVILAAVGLLACGIKGPPRPPLEPNQVETAPDAGCCTERR